MSAPVPAVGVVCLRLGPVTERRTIARQLYITENTVRHHLEHVYNKTGSTNRVSATLFAMENGILSGPSA